MGPHVTVIIPTYNSDETLARSIDSVVQQTFPDWELIVVDDGSTDQTVGYLETIGSKRLKIVRHDRNRGAAAARNTGISQARGRWIAFLDADDQWRPEKLHRQLAHLVGQPQGIKASSTGYYLHKAGRVSIVQPNLTAIRFKEDVLFGCTISPGSTLLISAEAFDRVGRFDESLRRLEDWDWLLRYNEKYEMTFLPEPLVHVHTSAPKGPAAAARYAVVKEALDRLDGKHRSSFVSGVRRKRFRSTIFVEKAAGLYRCGRPLVAILNVLIALAIYPNRNLAFFRTLWRSVRPRRSA